MEEALTEEHIVRLVRRFYALAFADELLGPLFRRHIADLEAHYAVVENFWSYSLLGTDRYKGTPYAPHAHLTVEEAHFAHWLRAFETAARETLPAPAAGLAVRRARHMTESFKMGLLPLKPPARKPAA